MKTRGSLFTLSVLSGLVASAWAVDTSNWKCESCPFDKTSGGTIDAGLLVLSDGATRYGDYTGLARKGGHLVLGVAGRRRGDDGHYLDFKLSDLGLDTRAADGEAGIEGVGRVRFGYVGSTHRSGEGGASPFFTLGDGRLRLPAGYPAADTNSMPLATTLSAAEPVVKRTRTDAAAAWDWSDQWSGRLSVRRDERDGTQRSAGSFFSTSSQLLLPVSQNTEQFEVSVAFARPDFQAALGYSVSHFSNDLKSVSWANPFVPVVAGADSGRLAGAPDNTFQQVSASAGYRVLPWLRASGEFALGRGTQNEPFLAITENAALAAGLPALAAASLNGKVETLNANVHVSATPMPDLRVDGSYLRDVRDNKTATLAMPAVSTDMFAAAALRTAVPYGFVQDRYKLEGQLRLPQRWKARAGLDWDQRERTYQEAVTTRETTAWLRGSGQPAAGFAIDAKLAQAERRNQGYGVATQIQPVENPLLRKFNMADRSRTSMTLRGDINAIESLTLGLRLDWAKDDYKHSQVGLTDARQEGAGIDASYALDDQTQLYGYLQSERIRSRQAGSQGFTTGQPAADWWGRSRDRFELAGLGARTSLLKGKLDVSADVTRSRSNGDITIDLAAGPSVFPTARVSVDGLKLQAGYKVADGWWLIGSYAYEHFDSQDWHLDGVTPSSVPNLLALGELAPNYKVHAVQIAVRMRF